MVSESDSWFRMAFWLDNSFSMVWSMRETAFKVSWSIFWEFMYRDSCSTQIDEILSSSRLKSLRMGWRSVNILGGLEGGFWD